MTDQTAAADDGIALETPTITPPGADTPAARRAYRQAPRVGSPARTEPRAEEAPPPGARLVRNRKRTQDKFNIDPRRIPPGLSWEWKREACYGKSDDFYMTELRENHWTPVESDKHPGLVVKQDGQVLMQRPAYLTREALQEGAGEAYRQLSIVQGQAAATPQGQMPRKLSKVSSQFDIALPGGDVGVPIPDDE